MSSVSVYLFCSAILSFSTLVIIIANLVERDLRNSVLVSKVLGIV